MVPGGQWYGWVRGTSTIGSVAQRGFGPSLGFHLIQEWCPVRLISLEPTTMAKDLITRGWRLAVTIGPLVAIALSLAAGYKWR